MSTKKHVSCRVVVRNLPATVYDSEIAFNIGLRIAIENAKPATIIKKHGFDMDSLNGFFFIRAAKGKAENKAAKKLAAPGRVYMGFRSPLASLIFCALVDGLEFPNKLPSPDTISTDPSVPIPIDDAMRFYPCNCERLLRTAKFDEELYGKPNNIKNKIEADPQFKSFVANLRNPQPTQPVSISASQGQVSASDASKSAKKPAIAEFLFQQAKWTVVKPKAKGKKDSSKSKSSSSVSVSASKDKSKSKKEKSKDDKKKRKSNSEKKDSTKKQQKKPVVLAKPSDSSTPSKSAGTESSKSSAKPKRQKETKKNDSSDKRSKTSQPNPNPI